MTKKAKYITMMVVVGLIIATAGAGVLYGVLTHSERGLLTVCWEDPKPRYDAKDCKNELTWAKDLMPLTYFFDFDLAHTKYIKPISMGAELWNTEIGPVFKRVDNINEARIVISWGTTSHGGAGYVTHQGNDKDGARSARILFSVPEDQRSIYKLAAHEFGHVLGLAHDEHAVMKPGIVVEGMDDQMKFVLPSDDDKKMLRGLYR